MSNASGNKEVGKLETPTVEQIWGCKVRQELTWVWIFVKDTEVDKILSCTNL